jgi:hypothetical protein
MESLADKHEAGLIASEEHDRRSNLRGLPHAAGEHLVDAKRFLGKMDHALGRALEVGTIGACHPVQ